MQFRFFSASSCYEPCARFGRCSIVIPSLPHHGIATPTQETQTSLETFRLTVMGNGCVFFLHRSRAKATEVEREEFEKGSVGRGQVPSK